MPSDDVIHELIEGGFLREQSKDPGQAKRHLLRAQRDLKTADANLEIDEEAAYTFAYLAMLRSARALMFLKGYRPADGRQHKTVVDVATCYLGKGNEDLAYKFEAMRRTRNRFTYEPDLPLGRKESEEALETAKRFVQWIIGRARKVEPGLRLDD